MCNGDSKSKSVRHKFLTVREVAEELNISERSAWRLIEDGELPSYLFEGCRRVKRQDLEEYIMRCLQLERNSRNR
jgi:excisionase family DNA binding protein